MGNMMRILILNPNTSKDFTKSIESSIQELKEPGIEFICTNPTAGPRSIECAYDEIISCAPCLELLINNKNDFDGVVIGCYGHHPVIPAAREILNQPVIGIMEAAIHFACIAGETFSIIGSGDRTLTMFREAVRAYGVENRCASIRATGTPVLALERSTKHVVEELILNEARKAVEEDGAEVISLGCAGIVGLDKRLSDELKVPVIDGVSAGIKLIEGLLCCGVKTSKRRAFSPPFKKELVNLPEVFSKPYIPIS